MSHPTENPADTDPLLGRLRELATGEKTQWLFQLMLASELRREAPGSLTKDDPTWEAAADLIEEAVTHVENTRGALVRLVGLREGDGQMELSPASGSSLAETLRLKDRQVFGLLVRMRTSLEGILSLLGADHWDAKRQIKALLELLEKPGPFFTHFSGWEVERHGQQWRMPHETPSTYTEAYAEHEASQNAPDCDCIYSFDTTPEKFAEGVEATLAEEHKKFGIRKPIPRIDTPNRLCNGDEKIIMERRLAEKGRYDDIPGLDMATLKDISALLPVVDYFLGHFPFSPEDICAVLTEHGVEEKVLLDTMKKMRGR